MIVYLFENDNNNASVVYDETTLTEQEKTKGIPVAELPTAETPEGKQAVLKCKKSTGEVWYEYVDIPVDNTEQRIIDLEIAMAAIMGGAL
jgi:hypothetical protein